MAFQTEVDFTLPKGYVDADGTLHREGTMRLATAADERVKDDALVVDLMDGRTISVPLAWYPRLINAARPTGKLGNLL